MCEPACAKNAHCEYGQPNKCVCNQGTSGNPYEGCGASARTCSTASCGKGATCKEGGGRVDCVCPAGYRGNPYVECTDVDECMGNSCGMNALCINTPGSYDCRCKQGFQGNPFLMCMPPSTTRTDCASNPDNCQCSDSNTCPTG